jgi:hypothetical protein
MTCVNAVPMHGHAKEPVEFIGVQHREACDFPRALPEWIGPHVVEMEPHCRPALLKNEVNHGTMSTSKRVQD